MKKYFIRGVNPVILAIIGLLIIGVSFAGCRHIGAYLYGDEFYGEYYYETDSVDDYLYLPYNDTFFNGGLWDQKEMIKCVKMMFPPKIEPYFADVRYHLKAYDNWGSMLEAVLEFTIEDPVQFNGYISTLLGDRETTPFYFDNEWVEYVVADKLTCFGDIESGGVDICSFQIAKVMINYKQQRVLFVVAVEYETGGLPKNDFNVYFSRFNIDVGQYEKYTEHNEFISDIEMRERALLKD